MKWPAVRLSFLLLLPACGPPRPPGCVAGDQKSCPCPGGGLGVQVCLRNATYGECESCPAHPDLSPAPEDMLVTVDTSVPPDEATPIDVMPAARDMAMPDLAMPDLAMPDLAMPDLAMPDLAMPDLVPPVDLTSLPDLSVKLGGKRVFVSSAMYIGAFGGVTGADAKCQALADNAGLGGTFKAWISGPSTASSPSVRFTHSAGPYRLVDGTLIAGDWTALTSGTLAHPINMTEKGGGAPSSLVFTYTLQDGTPGLTVSKNCYGGDCHCNNWTNPNQQGNPIPGSAVGQSGATNRQWTDYSFYNGCGGDQPIYCFEQ